MLMMGIKKNKEWMIFELPNGEKIKILIKTHKSGNPNQAVIAIDCPKNIKINRLINDNIGNQKG